MEAYQCMSQRENAVLYSNVSEEILILKYEMFEERHSEFDVFFLIEQQQRRRVTRRIHSSSLCGVWCLHTRIWIPHYDNLLCSILFNFTSMCAALIGQHTLYEQIIIRRSKVILSYLEKVNFIPEPITHF